MAGTRESARALTLADLVEVVIEVSEDERETVAVVVHLLESGRVRLLGPERKHGRSLQRPLRKTA